MSERIEPADVGSDQDVGRVERLLRDAVSGVSGPLFVPPGPGTTVAEVPITAEELMRRGVSEEIEGRALDVVLRCGWPRPGDPLGIKPCIPIEMRELRQVLKDAEDVIDTRARLELVVSFLERKLRTQEYVMALYVATADARAGS
jgi:hypothetical protein